jgi:thiosulfate/3-mercaptopyruvate sulfurtransferase
MFAKHVLGAALACALFGATPAGAQTQPLIVGAGELASLIAREHPVILSTQSSLENANEPGYLEGAYAVSEDLWRQNSATQAQLDDRALWNDLIGRLGIGSREKTVVVYDNGALKFASRIRFLLNHYGVKRAVLVNGGWPAIQTLIKEGKLQGQTLPNIPMKQAYASEVDNHPIIIATREQVSKVVVDHEDKGVTLIDVRTPQEYDGTFIFLDLKRPGHIPGAINLPLSELFDAKQPNMLLDAKGLLAVFLKYKIPPANSLIFYCQDGARSSLGALAANEAGYRQVRLYYLSYLNWQSFPDDPVIGPKPK